MALLNVMINSYEIHWPIPVRVLTGDAPAWLWMAILAGVACMVLCANIAASIVRKLRGAYSAGNILLAIWALFYGLVLVTGIDEVMAWIPLDASLLDRIVQGIGALAMALSVAQISFYFFPEQNIGNCILSSIYILGAAASVILPYIGIGEHTTYSFYLFLGVVAILCIYFLLAVVKGIIYRRSRYLVAVVLGFLAATCLTLGLWNESVWHMEEFLYDYRLIVLGYMLAVTVYSFLPLNQMAPNAARGENIDDLNKHNEELPALDHVLGQGISVSEIEDIENAEDIENTEKIENAESIENTESTENAESIENTESIENVENIENSESTKRAEDGRAAGVFAITEDIQEIESPNEDETADGTESPNETETADGTESPNETEKVPEPRVRVVPQTDSGNRDYLTGAMMRDSFMKELAAIGETTLEDRNVAVVVFDIDHLAVVNEERGYAAGDAMIVATCRLIEECFCEVGCVYRMDGDEFAVLIRDARPGIISAHLLTMLDAIKLYNEETKNPYSISFGYAVYSGKSHLKLESLLTLAHNRMMDKKKNGGCK